MSLGALIKVLRTERRISEDIERAKREAERILERARAEARDMLREENIIVLRDKLVEEYRRGLERELREYEEDEEFERLSLITDEELEELAEMLLEVILSE